MARRTKLERSPFHDGTGAAGAWGVPDRRIQMDLQKRLAAEVFGIGGDQT